MTATLSSAPTRERILDAAEPLMLAKSFHSVGLTEILKAVQVPKGSFYHYFESKEAFGVALLDHYCAKVTAFKESWLRDRETYPDPVERLLAFLDFACAAFVENDYQPTCLIVKLAAEVTTFSDAMRRPLERGYQSWNALYTEIVAEAIVGHRVRAEIDASRSGAAIGDLWVGAMIRASVARSTVPLDGARATIAAILAHP